MIALEATVPFFFFECPSGNIFELEERLGLGSFWLPFALRLFSIPIENAPVNKFFQTLFKARPCGSFLREHGQVGKRGLGSSTGSP